MLLSVACVFFLPKKRVDKRMKKKLVLLLNVGTPDKPSRVSVGKFLFQFLNDKYVMDIPWLPRLFLVNFIIVPFRVPKSTRLYQRLWTENGSPLLYYHHRLVNKLQKELPPHFIVAGAMRYGNPSVKDVLQKLDFDTIEEIIAIPLFPQYASATTETARQHLLKEVKSLGIKAHVQFLEQFYSEEKYIKAFAAQIRSYDIDSFDHILFSYHGLPNKQIRKIHPHTHPDKCNCPKEFPIDRKACYRGACYENTRLLTKALSISEEKYSIAFQSRMSRDWMAPFSDDVLLELLKEGKKRVLVVAPSFVTDCLETTVEIEMDYKKLFLENGGESLVMVQSLNDNDSWVEALKGIVQELSAQ